MSLAVSRVVTNNKDSAFKTNFTWSEGECKFKPAKDNLPTYEEKYTKLWNVGFANKNNWEKIKPCGVYVFMWYCVGYKYNKCRLKIRSICSFVDLSRGDFDLVLRPQSISLFRLVSKRAHLNHCLLQGVRYHPNELSDLIHTVQS